MIAFVLSLSAQAMSENWFEYPIRVQPHHTDYGGVVWHGTYITWMESARVECLRAAGAPFDALVKLGYDLPVVNLDVRYRHPLTLGAAAVIKTRLGPAKGIRFNWLYEIETVAEEDRTPIVCLTGQVTLVPVDLEQRRVVRRMPDEVRAIADKVAAFLDA